MSKLFYDNKSIVMYPLDKKGRVGVLLFTFIGKTIWRNLSSILKQINSLLMSCITLSIE